MSDLRDVEASYCPHCGRQVASAQATAAEEAFAAAAQGVAKSDDAHVVIEGAEVRVYVHEESDGQ